MTRERDEARAQLESAVLASRTGGADELANGKRGGEDEDAPPAKRVSASFLAVAAHYRALQTYCR